MFPRKNIQQYSNFNGPIIVPGSNPYYIPVIARQVRSLPLLAYIFVPLFLRGPLEHIDESLSERPSRCRSKQANFFQERAFFTALPHLLGERMCYNER